MQVCVCQCVRVCVLHTKQKFYLQLYRQGYIIRTPTTDLARLLCAASTSASALPPSACPLSLCLSLSLSPSLCPPPCTTVYSSLGHIEHCLGMPSSARCFGHRNAASSARLADKAHQTHTHQHTHTRTYGETTHICRYFRMEAGHSFSPNHRSKIANGISVIFGRQQGGTTAIFLLFFLFWGQSH